MSNEPTTDCIFLKYFDEDDLLLASKLLKAYDEAKNDKKSIVNTLNLNLLRISKYYNNELYLTDGEMDLVIEDGEFKEVLYLPDCGFYGTIKEILETFTKLSVLDDYDLDIINDYAVKNNCEVLIKRIFKIRGF